MSYLKIAFLLKIAAATICAICADETVANAVILNQGSTIHTFTECINDGIALVVGTSSLDENGWYHTIDTPNDSVPYGGSAYEIYGMSVRETADSIWVVLRANMALTGVYEPAAADGNIGWGDLFLNFSGLDFNTAISQGEMFGVRFADSNDSGVNSAGVYSGVTATTVVGENLGFSSFQDYNQFVGENASLGDLTADTSYFNQSQSWNVIASGNFVTNITYLTIDDLVPASYDLQQFSGRHTISFKLDKSYLFGAVSIPESHGVVGIAAISLAFALNQLWQHSTNVKNRVIGNR
jgi:hypothetical protein